MDRAKDKRKRKEKKDRWANFSVLSSLSQSSPGLYFTLHFQPLTHKHTLGCPQVTRQRRTTHPVAGGRGEIKTDNVFLSLIFFLFSLGSTVRKNSLPTRQHTDMTAHSVPPTLPNSHLPSRNVTYGCDNEPKILLFKWANPRSLSFYTNQQPCLASDRKNIALPQFFFSKLSMASRVDVVTVQL